MSRDPRTSAALLVVTIILPVAAIARLWGLDFCLPHPHCRPDEDAISAIAGGFRAGDFNPHVYNYPAFFMLAVAGVLRLLPGAERLLHKITPFHFGSLIDQASTTSKNYMAARALSAAAGIASVWVLFRVGLRLFDRAGAVAAAALLALSFLHVRDSHFGVTDVAMSFMVLVAFACAVRLFQSGSRKDLVLAGLATGLAASTKYNGGIVALPVLFASCTCPPAATPLGSRLRDAGLAILMMVAAFLCASPYTVLDFQHFLADFMSDVQHLSGGHGVNVGRGWVYHVTTTLRYGIGTPLLVCGAAGMALLLARRPRAGILVALFPVAYYAVLGSGYTVFARHMIPVVPFLCLTGGYFLSETVALLVARIDRPAWQTPLLAAAVIGVLWPSVRSVAAFDPLIAQTDSRMLARLWIEGRFAEGSTIAQIGPEGGHVFLHDTSEVPYTTVDVSPTGVRPDIIVVQSSPVTGPPELAGIEDILRTEYTLAFVRHVAGDDPANVYDLQDEFYMPLAGFRQIERPGPNLDVYVHNGVSFHPSDLRRDALAAKEKK